MFRETPNVRQIKGDPKRRWFTDDDLELIVWFGKENRIIGFQLCYEIERQPKALTSQETDSFFHNGIDDGEQWPGGHKSTPILVPDGIFDKENAGKRFARSSQSLPAEIAEFVTRKIAEYNQR